MTVSTTNASKTYDGDNSTTAFPTTFAFNTSDDIEVIERIKATGVETTKTLTTDYTVAGGGGAGSEPATGTVNAVTAPADTVSWTIRRVVAETQTTDLPTAGAFPSSGVETVLDRLVMMIQQHSEEIGRALLASATSGLSGLTIPDPVANNLLGWNSGATNLENKVITDASTTVISSFMATLLDDSSALDARTTLDFTKGEDITSAAALTLGTDGNYFDVTGTTTITSINTWNVGDIVRLHFDDALTLTHHATNLVLPGGANITTATGDEFTFVEYASGSFRCIAYALASGRAVVEPSEALPRSYLAGLQLSNGTDASHDIDIAVGECRDVDQSENMALATAITKQIDATWSVGTNQGGLDTGTVANNTWYHVFIIKRTDTGVVDALFSTSVSSPSTPANYDKKRRIGAVRTDGSANIIAFMQNGDRFTWDVSREDLSTGSISTSGTDITMSAPSGVVTRVLFNATNGGDANTHIYFYPKDTTGAQPGFGVHPLGQVGVGGSEDTGYAEVDTDTSSTIVGRGSGAAVDVTVSTLGYIDRRGRDD